MSGPKDDMACREMSQYTRLESICLHKNEENLSRWGAAEIVQIVASENKHEMF